MFKLIKTNENEYRIEGLTAVQVLRIYKALEAVNNKGYTMELQVMVDCLKMDIDKINREQKG